MSQRPCIVGVRHHSPACARLVRRRILELRPDRVLIEGPSDFNPLRQQLLLDHQLPIAVFSSLGGQSRSYSPFCDYSPEWVALRTAHEIGAEFLFMDLPPWRVGPDDASLGIASACSPGALARRMGYDSSDALWDAMVEQADEPQLEQQLDEYFQLLRQQVGERDRQREEYMAQAISWACHQGSCLVVCGGFHAPFLEQNWNRYPPHWPALETPAEARAFLVPFSFQRLSSLTGYEAGMTCPQYYQRLWETDWEVAGQECMVAAAEELRRRQQPVSTADLIAAFAQAEGLRRLRGHRRALRCDLLDGLLSALCKEALEVLPPWSCEGPLQPDSHPQLVALLAAFTGTRRGRLCATTPRPPLLWEVEDGLRHFGFQPTRPPRQVVTTVDTDPSRFLRRLEILELPGIQCLADAPETWSLGKHEDFEACLLEASAYGADLKSASAAALQEQAKQWQGARQIAHCLLAAARAGLEDLSQRWLVPLAAELSREVRLEELAPALDSLALTLKVFPRLDPELTLLVAGLERLLWLLEGQLGQPEAAVEAIRVSRDLMRNPQLPRQAGLEVMGRLARHSRPPVRGAALGLVWCLRGQPPELFETLHGVGELGDFLWGLFRLAREEVIGQVPLLKAIHEQVVALEAEDFLRQLPGLRQAFQEFPPRQKEQLALQVAGWLGLEGARELTRSRFDPGLMERAVRLDRALQEEMQRLGW